MITVIPDDDPLMGMPRLAETLHVTDPTARSYVLRGLLPATIIDGRLFVRASDVAKFREAYPVPLPRNSFAVEFKSSEAR